MAQQFSQDVLDAMRKRAAAVRARMAGGGDFARYAGLSGKNAIAEPGGFVDVRLLPHWNWFVERYMTGKDGRTAENPAYKRREACFGALQHWYDDVNGKRTRDWCRKNLGDQEPCPLCDAADAWKGGTAAEQKRGRDMTASEIYLYNAILRDQPFGEDGKPAIRILCAPATVYVKVVGLCTGEESEKYALGDVTDPIEGYDLQIIRPASQGDRYDVKANPKGPSRLYEKGDQRWAGWHRMLYDLEKDVVDNVPTVEGFERKLYGAAGAPAPETAASWATGASSAADEFPGETAGEEAPPPGSGDGGAFGEFDMPGEEPPSAPAPPARRPSPLAAPSASRGPVPGRRR